MLICYLFYSCERGVRERETFIDTICSRRGWQDLGERLSLTKNDTHLTWKLSVDIVIVLCFDCYSRVLAVSVFLFVLHF